MKLTRRMRFILDQMRRGAVIEESRDAFLEKSTYELTNHQNLFTAITEKMLHRLAGAKLIVIREHNPVYRHDEFVTSESIWSIPPLEVYRGYEIFQYDKTPAFWCALPEDDDAPSPGYFEAESVDDCRRVIAEALDNKNIESEFKVLRTEIVKSGENGEIEEQVEILEVAGQEYRRFSYDWYILDALLLAPPDWNYDEIAHLRHAIRENYQHGHNYEVGFLAGNDEGLRAFVEAIEVLEMVPPGERISALKSAK
ncbi:MAG: hypothetical protein GY845_28560 [Planctomycetes bacterium]|nr:hypothetical protein [Planctomycetota bacterium]